MSIEELLDLSAEGQNIDARNIVVTLRNLVKIMENYRDDVPFDFKIEVKQRKMKV